MGSATSRSAGRQPPRPRASQPYQRASKRQKRNEHTPTTHGRTGLSAHLNYEVCATGRGDYKEGVAQVAKHGHAAAAAQRLPHLRIEHGSSTAIVSRRSCLHCAAGQLCMAGCWRVARTRSWQRARTASGAAGAHRHTVAGGRQLGGQRDAIQLVLLSQQDVAEQDHVALKLRRRGRERSCKSGARRRGKLCQYAGRDRRAASTGGLGLGRRAPSGCQRLPGTRVWRAGGREAEPPCEHNAPNKGRRPRDGRSRRSGPHLAVKAGGGGQQRLHRALEQGELCDHRRGLGARLGGQQALLALQQGRGGRWWAVGGGGSKRGRSGGLPGHHAPPRAPQG